MMVGCPTIARPPVARRHREHVDGLLHWRVRACAIARSAQAENWSEAARLTQILGRLLSTLQEYGVFPAAQEILPREGESRLFLAAAVPAVVGMSELASCWRNRPFKQS